MTPEDRKAHEEKVKATIEAVERYVARTVVIAFVALWLFSLMVKACQ
jgi:hypothetical protein